jgi:hypothetical protein
MGTRKLSGVGDTHGLEETWTGWEEIPYKKLEGEVDQQASPREDASAPHRHIRRRPELY